MAKDAKNEGALSKSKEKRQERQKLVSKQRREQTTKKVIGIVISVLIIGALAGTIGYNVYKSVNRTKAISDFSKGLTEDGKIAGVDVASSLTLVDFANMVVPMSEVAATEDEVNEKIQSTLDAHKEASEDTSLEVKDGDTVNIDYVGTMDGVAFEGGNSNGEGYDLTIGSGSFVDTFEEQLIGSHPGDELTVKVTFPEDYQNADLAGKPADFAVTVHSISVSPELTDEFVKANLSDVASTAAEYRKSIEDDFYQSHLEEYISKKIVEDSTVISYPKSYVKTTKGILRYNDEYTMNYYNQMFASYGINYENPWDVRDGIEDEAAYEAELVTRAQEAVKTSLVYQGIFEKAGLSIDYDAYIAELTEENGEEQVATMTETYGKAYMMQTKMSELVMDYLKENVKVQ